VLRAPPLWFYVLREAGSHYGESGLRLGPVGGRIVAEVLVGLLEADPSSFLRREPTWVPTLPTAQPYDFADAGSDGFTMRDLVDFTLCDDPADTPES
jgi:hypothetical protein